MKLQEENITFIIWEKNKEIAPTTKFRINSSYKYTKKIIFFFVIWLQQKTIKTVHKLSIKVEANKDICSVCENSCFERFWQLKSNVSQRLYSKYVENSLYRIPHEIIASLYFMNIMNSY